MTEQPSIPKQKRRKLSDKELLDMAKEMNPEIGNDFMTESERNLREFFRGIKLI